jgi:hypothetical protein
VQKIAKYDDFIEIPCTMKIYTRRMNKNAIIFYWPLFIVGVCNDAAAHIVCD